MSCKTNRGYKSAFCLGIVLFGLCCSRNGLAQVFYSANVDNLVSTQTNLTITNLNNGYYLWDSTQQVTNNNLYALQNIYAVDTSLMIDGYNGQWDNTNKTWGVSNGNYTGTATTANATITIPMDPSDTNLQITPGFGVTTASDLSAFSLGDFAPGQVKLEDLDFKVSSNASTMNSYFNWVTPLATTPEPGALPVFAAAMLAAGTFALQRRRS